MNRRSLLCGAGALLGAGATGAAAWAKASGPLRRNRPGDKGWPSPMDWARLKHEVGGALVRPALPWSNCLTPDTRQACLGDLKNLFNPFFLGDQPAGTQVSGYLDAWRPEPSAYAVAARNVADVAKAVDFARAHNLRLVVKGGGHSYQGTSNAPDSLLVWTRAMREITLHEAFVAQGCAAISKPQHAVTVGAGAMWIDAYDAVTTKAGRYVQGGGCTTVGVAGLVQGGGFGSFSKAFGMAAANLLEAEIVTADGRVRTVNARRDPELFWALKGGGGGTFGVVTKLTLRTHELPDQFGGVGFKVKAASDAAFERLVEHFLGFYADRLLNPHWGEQIRIGSDNVLGISMVVQGLSAEEANRAWLPFIDWAGSAPDDFRFTEAFGLGTAPAQGWWDVEARRKRGSKALVSDTRAGAPPAHAWWSGDQEQVSVFLNGYDSVWLSADLLKPTSRGGLAGALVKASRHNSVELHLNKGLAGAAPDAIAAARETAMNPAVLNAFALAIVAGGGFPPYPGLPGPPKDLAPARRNAAAIAAAAAELRKVAPEAGSYVSESNYFSADWREAFWGGHYPRLRKVKQRYDPHDLFIVHHGVGSEVWSADGFARVKRI